MSPTAPVTLIRLDNVAKNVSVGTYWNQAVVIKSHQQVHISISTASSSGLFRNKTNKKENNCQTNRSDRLYAKHLELENACNHAASISSSMYKMEMTVGAETTIMYLIVSVFDTRATPNLINATCLKSQCNSPIKRQKVTPF